SSSCAPIIKVRAGTIALISLALPAARRLRSVLLAIGLGGASLFFGDAMITPAISVLSAIEGLQFADSLLEEAVMSELVSEAKFPASWEITGNLASAGHQGGP